MLADVIDWSVESAETNLFCLSVWLVCYSLVMEQIRVSYKKKYGVELHERLESAMSD